MGAKKQLADCSIQRILVRSTNWIGDAVMTTPALGAIRAQFPTAEIVLLATPLVAELFHHHPSVDRIIVYDKKASHAGFKGLLKLTAQLRKQKFDLAILLQNAIEAAIIAALAGIPRRAGYTTDGRRLLLNYPVPVTAKDKCLHHTEYYLKLLKSLGIAGGDNVLALNCSTDELGWAKSLTPDQAPIVINPGAAYGSAKRWFPERFAEVADALSEQYQAPILLTGGPGELEIGADIAAAMKTEPLNFIGKTSVREMMAIMSAGRLLITNDSGPMHVGAAFGIPIVAVFGPTDHTTTSPHSEKVKIVRKEFDCAPCLLRQCPIDHRCMLAIEAADVIAAAQELLS